MNILSFHVFTTRDGGLWIDDNYRWTSRFLDAAEFPTEERAKFVGDEMAGKDDTIYVFACMAS